jgi:hypothetical protein
VAATAPLWLVGTAAASGGQSWRRIVYQHFFLQNIGQHFCCKMVATLFSIEILIQLF